MPPTWKTFDEHTAAALKDHVEDIAVSVGPLSKPLFAEGDSVVIAPTLQKGAALVITARTKATLAKADEPAHFSPLVEEIATPGAWNAAPVELNPEPEIVAPEPDLQPIEVPQHPELAFGPTSWEQRDEAEIPAELPSQQSEAHRTDPEVLELPSHVPPQPPIEEIAPEENLVTASPDWAEERFVATGFLGLEDYVEDEEEISRAKRPWWKRIFSD